MKWKSKRGGVGVGVGEGEGGGGGRARNVVTAIIFKGQTTIFLFANFNN